MRVRGRLPEHRVAAPGGGEHQLGPVFPGAVEDHVDRCTAPPTRAQPDPLDDHRIGGPLVERDRVAVERLGARPSPRGAEHQVTAGQRDPQQVGQPGILVRVDRDEQLHGHRVCRVSGQHEVCAARRAWRVQWNRIRRIELSVLRYPQPTRLTCLTSRL